MPVISVSNIARHGIISDEPSHMQPPEAWTNALNMRFIDGKAVKFLGDAEVMNPPTVAPAHLMNVQVPAGPFWFYASAIGAGSKIYGFNTGAHSDMSRGGDYSADTPADWNSTIFQGIPIINNGTDVPQFLSTISLASNFADLTNWDGTKRAEVIRAYKNYLVALNITESGTALLHRVLVSDSAEPGFLPTSWDPTDPAVDALEFDLSDVNSGEILDGMPLRDMFIIYKGESTWIMRHIGGQLIMAFDPILQTAGLLAKRCVVPIALPLQKVQVHFLHNGQDLGVFNGQDFESVVDKKVRKRLNSSIDAQFYTQAFCVDNPAQDEVWFCYPETGNQIPNMALVWNYRQNTCTFREFRGVHAITGVVESQSNLTYATVDAAMSYDSSYPLQYADVSRRKLVIANQTDTELLQADFGDDFNGTIFEGSIERTNLAIIGQDREGAPLLDYQQRRLMKRLWPKVTGNSIRIYFGGRDKIGGEVTWQTEMVYDSDSEFPFIDPPEPLNVRLPAIKFESIDGLPFEIEGYDIDIEPLGDN